ncbi:MAG TPA: sigma-70 family RNA polymerase sigma factor [Planctomycetota bacterium]|nr:sigma-70 family RNA polymerase sigma factor [Planctomycetota bacterium]
MQSKTDSELVTLYAGGGAGGDSAFAEIVRRHGGLVYAACRRLLGDAAAEDAVQAVFMLLARKAGSLSRGEALAGWLYGAASLVAREHLRSARRRANAEKEAASVREAEKGGAAGPSWAELRPEIDAALGALPRPYRDAVVLSCLEGRPEAEVARELGVPAGTVKSRVSRGLERLRERLGGRGTVTSAAALAGLLGAHGAEAMPAALAAKVAGLGVIGTAGAAGVGAGSMSCLMMESAMKAMFWVKVKLAAAALVGAAAVGGGGAAVIIAAAEPRPEAPVVEGKAMEKGIECQVVELIPGGKVRLSAGSVQGVREKFEFDVVRGRKPVGSVKVVSVEEKQSTAEIASVTGEIKVGDTAKTRFGTVLAGPPAGDKPVAPAAAGTIAWGEAVDGLQAGLVPLGGQPSVASTIVSGLSRRISAGKPIARSLAEIAGESTGKVAEAAALMDKDIRAGKSLAEAMAAQPEVFDAAMVEAVRKGEDARTVDLALAALADRLAAASQGSGSAGGWTGFECPECSKRAIRKNAPRQCSRCGQEEAAWTANPTCPSCAAKERVCTGCGAAKPWGPTFAEGEPLAFEYHLRNVGDAALRALNAGPTKWQLTFVPKGGSVIRAARYAPQRPAMGTDWAPIPLAAGRHETIPVAVDGDWQFDDATPGARTAVPEPIKQLPAGRYTVTATYPGGKVSTGAVEIEIRPKGTAAVPTQEEIVKLARAIGEKRWPEQVKGYLSGSTPPCLEIGPTVTREGQGWRVIFEHAMNAPAGGTHVTVLLDAGGKEVETRCLWASH